MPAGFRVNSSEFRPIPGPEQAGSGWICRGQRVSAVVVVVFVVGRSHQASSSIPMSSGQFRTRSRRDLIGSVGGSGLFCCCCRRRCCGGRWWWWRRVLPIGFHDNSGEYRPSPDPEQTGSGPICRGQRVVLLLPLLLLVVVVVSLVAWSGVASRFPRQFRRVPDNSGPRADGIWSDLSGAAG